MKDDEIKSIPVNLPFPPDKLPDNKPGKVTPIKDEPEDMNVTAIRILNNMNGDAEAEHAVADDLLCEVLAFHGHIDVVKAYYDARKRVGFWYA